MNKSRFIPLSTFAAILLFSLGLSSHNNTFSDTGSQINGIDVSADQGVIDWDAVKQSGVVVWAYARASEGITLRDQTFRENFQAMKEAGILRGAYHFFYAGDAAERQFSNLESQVGDDWGELPPMLDLEAGGLSEEPDISFEDYQSEALKMLQLMEQKAGKKPVLYTSSSFGNGQYLNSPDFTAYRLWVADYGTNTQTNFPPTGSPKVPDPWAETGWTMWQFSSVGNISGITQKVDLDVFNGSLEELKGLK